MSCCTDHKEIDLYNFQLDAIHDKAQVKECIELFAPKLILGISDEMSSTGDLERIRIVREMVDEYNRTLVQK